MENGIPKFRIQKIVFDTSGSSREQAERCSLTLTLTLTLSLMTINEDSEVRMHFILI